MNNNLSDLDLMIIKDNYDTQDCGSCVLDGIRIEYFVESLKTIYQKIKEEIQNNDPSHLTKFATCLIYYDKEGKVKELINFAKEAYDTKIEHTLSDNDRFGIFGINNRIEDLESLINNNSFYEYDNISKKITDIKYKESLRLYFDFLKKDMSLSSYDKDNLTSFARLILLTKTDKSKAEDEVDKPEIAFEYDMNKMLIKYLLIDNEADKYKFITDVALPNAQRNNDMHNTNYFMDELASISMHNFKYKVFTTFYYKISNKTF